MTHNQEKISVNRKRFRNDRFGGFRRQGLEKDYHKLCSKDLKENMNIKRNGQYEANLTSRGEKFNIENEKCFTED